MYVYAVITYLYWSNINSQVPYYTYIESFSERARSHRGVDAAPYSWSCPIVYSTLAVLSVLQIYHYTMLDVRRGKIRPGMFAIC